MNQVLAAIIALGTISALIHWAWKRYGGIGAKKRKIKKQIRENRKEMRQALREGRSDDYSRFLTKREQLHEELRNLR